ncbi:MAG TPA: hypothetical protein DEW22_03215 [Clostridiales bacterium]|nr:hypothetical protein [Clostridiales bacterium]
MLFQALTLRFSAHTDSAAKNILYYYITVCYFVKVFVFIILQVTLKNFLSIFTVYLSKQTILYAAMTALCPIYL